MHTKHAILILLCLCQTVVCKHTKKDMDTDDGRRMGYEEAKKSKKQGAGRTSKDDQPPDVNKPISAPISSQQCLDSLLHDAMRIIWTNTSLTEQEQYQRSYDLSYKYEQFLEALNRAKAGVDTSSSNTNHPLFENDNDNVNGKYRCIGKNCIADDDAAQDMHSKPMDRVWYNRTSLLRHTALRHLRPNISRIIGSDSWPQNGNYIRGDNKHQTNSDGQDDQDDFIQKQGLPRVVDYKQQGPDGLIKPQSRILSRTDRNVVEINPQRQNFTRSFQPITTSDASMAVITKIPEIHTPTVWWNEIWFWMIHIITLILLLILILSCCIWFCGASKRRNYNSF